jgi:spore germination protein GerM
MTKLYTAAFLLIAFAVTSFGQATTNVKVFYLNAKDDPNIEDCNAVKPVTRAIPRTKGIAKAALLELFKGVNEEEGARGFVSFDPAETSGILKNLNIKNGVAFVNFNAVVYEKLGNATTSCGGGFFASVGATLKQFRTVKKVVYAVEGDTDGFYEWVQVGECPHGRKMCSKHNFR